MIAGYKPNKVVSSRVVLVDTVFPLDVYPPTGGRE